MGRTGERRDRSATRATILRAASDVLVEEGLSGTTTRRIAERAGVNLASVHYHFGSLDKLFEDVMIDLAETQFARYAPAGSDGEVLSRWRGGLERLVGLDPDPDAAFPKAYMEVLTLALSSPTLMEIFVSRIVKPSVDMVRAAIVERLGPGPEVGAEAERLTWLLVTLYRGLIINRLVGVPPADRRTLEMLERLLAERLGP